MPAWNRNRKLYRCDPFLSANPTVPGDAERFRMGRALTTNDLVIANGIDKNLEVFLARFLRCHGLLHFIACCVLGGPERTDDAIENCWSKVSRNAPHFEHEGAFRSWLVRVLIDQALTIFRETQGNAQDEIALRTRFLRSTKPIRQKRTVRLKAAVEGEY